MMIYLYNMYVENFYFIKSIIGVLTGTTPIAKIFKQLDFNINKDKFDILTICEK